MNVKAKLEIPEYKSQPRWMISARSYLIDRGVPKVERILLPGATYPSGTLEYSIDGAAAVSCSSNITRIKRLRTKIKQRWKPISVSENLILDFRSYYPGNWSHALNSHLPLAFFLVEKAREAGVDRKIDILFDDGFPDYILEVFSYFGFSCIRCSGDVRGHFYKYRVTPFASINVLAYEWVDEYVHTKKPFQDLLTRPCDLPKKIFLSRKKTRFLLNENEVESFLVGKGYRKYYAEDLSIEDQFSMFIHATDIVAVHGAALAPILYRPKTRDPLNLVEIMTAGHISSHFRILADKINANWMGVRGAIQPKMVSDAYEGGGDFSRHSLEPFAADLESIEIALAAIDKNDGSPELF